jgi:hypothetical protein
MPIHHAFGSPENEPYHSYIAKWQGPSGSDTRPPDSLFSVSDNFPANFLIPVYGFNAKFLNLPVPV